MGSGRSGSRSRKRKRRVLALVLFALALAVGGAIAGRYWRPGPKKDPKYLGLLQAALGEFQAGRYEQANAILDRRAAETAPTSLDWMLRARIAEAQGRLEEALDDLKHIPDTDQIGAQAWLKAGQIELLRHRARPAEAAYLHALALNPDQIQSHRELAYLYAVQRRKAECDEQFRVLFRLMPFDHLLAFAWCQNYCDLWDVPGARKVLIPMVNLDPTDRTSRLALASSYALANRREETEATLRPLPKSDPDALAMRVQLAIDQGDLESAAELVRQGPEDHARLNFYRGRLALDASKLSQAVAYFRAALRQDPDDRDAIHALGVVLQRLGDPQSKEFLQIAGQHDHLKRTIKDSVTTLETDKKLFYKLGNICESLNRWEEARVWYQLAVERDPLDAQAQQALAHLNQAAPGRGRDSTFKPGKPL